MPSTLSTLCVGGDWARWEVTSITGGGDAAGRIRIVRPTFWLPHVAGIGLLLLFQCAHSGDPGHSVGAVVADVEQGGLARGANRR